METNQNSDQYNQVRQPTPEERKKRNSLITIALAIGLAIAAFAIYRGVESRHDGNDSQDQRPAAHAPADANP